jgi:hypothetical protein
MELINKIPTMLFACLGAFFILAFATFIGYMLVSYNNRELSRRKYEHIDEYTTRYIDHKRGIELYYSKYGFAVVKIDKQ